MNALRRLTWIALLFSLSAAPAFAQEVEDPAPTLSRLSIDRRGSRPLALRTVRRLGFARLVAVELDYAGRVILAGTELLHGDPGRGVELESPRIVRLLPSGRRDPTFEGLSVGTQSLIGAPTGLAVDGVDRIVITGRFVSKSGAVYRTLRFSRRGGSGSPLSTLNPQMAPGGSLDGAWSRLHVVEGYDEFSTATFRGALLFVVETIAGDRIVRLTPAGTLDATFGAGGVVDLGALEVRDMAVDRQGRAVVSVRQDDEPPRIVRYELDGSLDTEFGGGGELKGRTGATLSGYTVRVDGQDRIVVRGSSDGAWGYYRFDRDGVLDTSFSGDGYARVWRGVASNVEEGDQFAVSTGETDRWIVYGHAGFLRRSMSAYTHLGWHLQAIAPARPSDIATHLFRGHRTRRGYSIRVQDAAISLDGRSAIVVGHEEMGRRQLKYRPFLAWVDLRPRGRVPLPNLRLAWPKQPRADTDGGSFTLSGRVRVRNVGPGIAANTEVSFYLSYDDMLDADDDRLGLGTTGRLASGAVSLVRLPRTQYTLGDRFPPAGQRIIAVVNRDGSQPETDVTDGVAVSEPLR